MTNKKSFCLLFLTIMLVLLLNVGLVSADDTDNSKVLKDINELSTPDKYDVDKVVQSDLNTKSEANVEKTCSNYTNKSIKYNLHNYTFVNKTITNMIIIFFIHE